MEAECPFDWRGLTRMLLGNSDHDLHSLRRQQHLVEAEEGVFERPPEVLPGLVLSLLPQFFWKELLTEFCAFNTTMAVKHCKET